MFPLQDKFWILDSTPYYMREALRLTQDDFDITEVRAAYIHAYVRAKCVDAPSFVHRGRSLLHARDAAAAARFVLWCCSLGVVLPTMRRWLVSGLQRALVLCSSCCSSWWLKQALCFSLGPCRTCAKLVLKYITARAIHDYLRNRFFFFFFSVFGVLLSSRHVPQEDVVMTRVITSGVGSTVVIDPPIRYTVVDVGGQRNERKKWLHCFDDVKTIVFLISLAGYNQVPMYKQMC